MLLAIALAAVASACGGSNGSSADDTGEEDEPLRVALVTDIGGLNDRGFNALAYRGLQQAEKELGIDGQVFISKAPSDYVPNLSAGARQGFDLVIANGFLMGDAVATIAARFPETRFAIIDYSWDGLDGNPTNALGLVFAEQEAGYLAGVAAARTSKSKIVSAVGGQEVP